MDPSADGVIDPRVLPECHRQDEDKDAGKAEGKEPPWSGRGFSLGNLAGVFLQLVTMTLPGLFVVLTLGAAVHSWTPLSPAGGAGGVREPRDHAIWNREEYWRVVPRLER